MNIFPSPEEKDAAKLGHALSAEFNSLREDASERLSRYAEFTDEYERPRTAVIKGKVTDYGRAVQSQELQRHHIPMPYSHAIITKHAYRIAGRLPDLIAQRLDNSEYEMYTGDLKEKLLYSVYEESDAEQQFADAAHDGSLLGPGCFQVYYNPAYDQPRFRAVDPRHVLVVPGVDDPHDFEACYYFWEISVASFRAKYGMTPLPDGTDAHSIKTDNGTDKVCVVERWDRQTKVRMAGGHLLEPVTTHSYGFTPYVVIPNLGPYRDIWGYGDYEFFRHIAAYYETLMSRQADVIRATANGAYLEKGTGQSPKAVKQVIQQGGVAPSREKGSVEAIQPAEFGNGFVEHVSMMRDALNDLGFTPPASWGALGAASGSDRALQLQPQIELTALKQINWSAGLKRLNTMILKLIEQKSIGKSSYTGTKVRGAVSTPFRIVLNAAANEDYAITDSDGQPAVNPDGTAVKIPLNPKELIAGNYCTRVVWERRLDRDDPEFVLSELNKYAQAAQSLRTTLEHLGFENPEDEMDLIEAESERFPWVRSGMVELIKQQLSASAEGGGGDAGGGDIPSGLGSLFGSGGGQTGALNTDALNRGLNGSDNAGGSGPGPGGAKYGAA